MNNTVAKPFFIPTGLSTKKAYNNWDNTHRGLILLLLFMSGGKLDAETNDPIIINFAMSRMSNIYPSSFHSQAESLGYHKSSRMDTIETAAVLSDVAVGDNKY